MNHQDSNIQESVEPPAPSAPEHRCEHRTLSGRHCRQSTKDARSTLCPTHAAMEKQRHSADLAATLSADPDAFISAEGINHSLGELYTLLAQDRISPRRAAVLAYISNLLLRTLPAIDAEQGDDAGPQIIFDLPRPQRHSVDEPDASASEEDSYEASARARSSAVHSTGSGVSESRR
jgi:hypothetical protein